MKIGKTIAVYAIGLCLAFGGMWCLCWVTSHLMALLGVA